MPVKFGGGSGNMVYDPTTGQVTVNGAIVNAVNSVTD